MSVLTLLCQVDAGNLSGTIFPLETPPTAFISELKDVIKAQQPHGLRYIDANELTVWKLSTPLRFTECDFDEDEENKAFNELLAAFYRDPESVSRKLHPVCKIGSYFKEPAEESLHLIIQVPLLLNR
ncbi:uncharacterized protein DFL_001088 [Arthrobotrys flagrans]|uniref:Crinkler effector protein N-terminal domain-containing protein n=1 Tax=Arthrobotrys flagrans TaxID=97331 RepID=A0A437AG55_ARTFL|nr:hypothetical protein DFL_001088 [Arthrobotrys flagrans]